MLRRLRQPENIALIIALAALVHALVAATAIGAVDSSSFTGMRQTLLYGPYVTLTMTSQMMLVIGALASVILSMLLFEAKPVNRRTFPFRWFWAAILLGWGLLNTGQSAGLLLGLVTVPVGMILFATAAITRHPKFGSALVLMLTATVTLAITLVLNAFDQYDHIDSISVGNQAYALGMRPNRGYYCDQPTFHIFECDSWYLLCELAWSSPSECRAQPTAVHLTADDEQNSLIIQADDQTFEVTLEPPA